MAARDVPSNGDIVVREDRRDGAIVYVLGTAFGGDEITTFQYERSVEHALAFARRARVRAWLQTETTIRLLHDFGSPASV
jgi:hypothetical protein